MMRNVQLLVDCRMEEQMRRGGVSNRDTVVLIINDHQTE
jgi:hypothetical protein